MSLRLTPEMLVGAYEFLRTTPPFRRWHLPHADEIEFHLIRDRRRYAEYCGVERHRIGVNHLFVSRGDSLLMHMAHEMVHLRQKIEGSETAAQHNARFRVLARSVCRHHDFEYGRFV